MLKQTFEYRFEVNDDGDGEFYCVGGQSQNVEDARRNYANYIFSRDKRRKKPPMRIVEIITTESEFEIL